MRRHCTWMTAGGRELNCTCGSQASTAGWFPHRSMIGDGRTLATPKWEVKEGCREMAAAAATRRGKFPAASLLAARSPGRWPQKANVWRKATNPARRAKRLRGGMGVGQAALMSLPMEYPT